MNKYFLSVILLLHCLNTLAQSDTLKIGSIAQNTHPFRARQLVIPASLLATSIAIRHIKINEKTFDTYTKEKVLMHFGSKTKIDDYLQYTPIIGTFALSNLGIKATHSLKERLIVGATAHAIMGILVNTLKYTTRIERPDHSATNSFPSGHTAFAFTGAEMLWQEYKNENIWIGISGYTIATTVGVLRVYNNRHWVSGCIGRSQYWHS